MLLTSELPLDYNNKFLLQQPDKAFINLSIISTIQDYSKSIEINLPFVLIMTVDEPL